MFLVQVELPVLSFTYFYAMFHQIIAVCLYRQDDASLSKEKSMRSSGF
jgi:hypothetical protein